MRTVEQHHSRNHSDERHPRLHSLALSNIHTFGKGMHENLIEAARCWSFKNISTFEDGMLDLANFVPVRVLVSSNVAY